MIRMCSWSLQKSTQFKHLLSCFRRRIRSYSATSCQPSRICLWMTKSTSTFEFKVPTRLAKYWWTIARHWVTPNRCRIPKFVTRCSYIAWGLCASCSVLRRIAKHSNWSFLLTFLALLLTSATSTVTSRTTFRYWKSSIKSYPESNLKRFGPTSIRWGSSSKKATSLDLSENSKWLT